MPKVSPIISDFRGGEFSPLMYGQVQLDEYRTGMSECRNMIPIVQGALISRPGTQYVGYTKHKNKKARFIRFEYSTEQAYQLEFGDLYMRVWQDGGQVLEAAGNITGATNAATVVITEAGHGRTTGDEVYIAGIGGMTELNGRNFIVNVLTVNTYQLNNLDGIGIDSTSYGTYTSGGTASGIYEIVSPYSEDEIDALKFIQSADVLYIVHGDHEPQTLSRTGHTSWAFADYEHKWGPTLEENIDSANVLTVSALTGAGVTVTATGGHTPFTAEMVGAIISFRESMQAKNLKWEADKTVSAGDYRHYDGKLYENTSGGGTTGTNPPVHEIGTENDGKEDWLFLRGDRGYVVITGYTSSTVVTAEVIERIPDPYLVANGGWHQWAEGAWSERRGYPKAIAFYDGRIWFGGSATKPQTLWATESGDYTSFRPVNISGDVSAAESLTITLDSVDVNNIAWISEEERALLIGTSGGEWTVRPFRSTEALSGTNIAARKPTSNGCADVSPVKIGNAHLFVQRLNRKVRELAYVFEIDGFRAPDMTIISEHMTLSGVKQMAYFKEPHPIVWMILETGELISFVYDRIQNVLAWSKHPMSGEVESLSVIPDINGQTDQLWMIVKRTINGTVRRFVEILSPFNVESTNQSAACYYDCHLSYSGTAVTNLSGLEHLENELVGVMVDGAKHPDCTVVNGSISLSFEGSDILVGLKYTRRAKTLKIDAGAADGTSQGKTKRIHRVGFRVHNTAAFLAGHNDNNLREQIYNRSLPLGDPPALYSGDVSVEWGGDYETEGQITVESSNGFPLNLLAIMPQMVTQDRG